MIRTCTADEHTEITHVVAVPACCPVSKNPQPGSSISISYRPTTGTVLPVEDLEPMIAEYVGGLGSIRAMEEMIQDIARRCEATTSVPVHVIADLKILPPGGGQVQNMIVDCEPTPIPGDTPKDHAPGLVAQRLRQYARDISLRSRTIDEAADRIEQLEAEITELRGKLERAETSLAWAIPAEGESYDRMRASLFYTSQGRTLINRGDVGLYWLNQGDVNTAMLRAALTEQANIRSPVQSEG